MKHALEGIRVVELGGYIVASYCTSLLADMGAEVIKIESLQGDGLRPQLGSFQGWNRGKRGIAVDLRTEEGNMILHQLVQRADVLVQNLRVGVAERWGADYATLSGINPRLIYSAMPGYGQSGPYIEKPGFDPLIQARGGAMAGQGGAGNPPVFLRVPMSDNTGAMLGAFGVAMALYQRAKTGKGQYLHGALLNSCIASQSGEFVSYPGKGNSDPRVDEWGFDATYRIYRAEDGWFFLGCDEDSTWPILCQALDKKELISDPRFESSTGRRDNAGELIKVLEALFIKGASQHWLDLLENVGIPCARINRSVELFDHPHLLHNDLVAEHDSADVGRLKQMGMAIKLSKTPGKLWRAAPGLGQHTDEVLSELGYSEEEIQKLKEKRVVTQKTLEDTEKEKN